MAKDKKKKKKDSKKKLKLVDFREYSPYTGKETFLNKDTSMSVEDRIYSVPPTTFEFEVNRKYVMDTTGLTEKYSNEYILCVGALFGGMYNNSISSRIRSYALATTEMEDGTIRPLSYDELVPKNTPIIVSDDEFACENIKQPKDRIKRQVEYTNGYVGLAIPSVLQPFKDNYMKSQVQIVSRSNAEYNGKYLQYVSGVIIESENKVLLLKAISGRLKGKLTMVQGHVEYSKNYLTMSLLDFIKINAWKELSEEVTNVEECNISDEPIMVIDKDETLIDGEHIGLIYKYTTTDETIMKIESNEVDKHDVIVIDKVDLHKNEYMKMYDSWLCDVINIIYLNK